MSDRQRIEMLVASLAEIEPTEANLDQLFTDLNIPISMSMASDS